MKKINKAFSMLLALIMIWGLLPTGAMAAEHITVTFSAQNGGAFLFNRQEVEVKDGLAEEYGYAVAEKDHNDVAVEGATVFDALVAVHKAKYGDDFTPETAKNYLDISSGTLGKAFGQSAASTGFFVNGEMLNDGIVGIYGTTGYMIDAARLNANDNVELWFYQDNIYWSDYYTYFTETEKTVSENESFTLTLEGFMVMSAIGYEPKTDVINGEDGYITINTVNTDGSLSEALTDNDGGELLIDGSGQVTLLFDTAGEYIVTASGMEGDMGSPIIAPWCMVTVEPAQSVPTELTIICDDGRAVNDTTLLAKTGDTFQFKALDQDGNETPVKWSTTSSWVGSIDADSGLLTTTASFSSGSTSSASIEAVSMLDNSVSKTANFALSGYMFSDYQKNPSVALSTDGQTAKTVSASGGYNGHTNWSYEGAESIAQLAADQDLSAKKNSIKFNALRPGTFTATFTLDFDESMTDTAIFTITGVAVEDSEGNQSKTYLTKTADEPNPTMQLTAYTTDECTVTAWSSSDEAVAVVDENGLVTAQGIGSAIITATDSEGVKGGIKVVVQDAVTPYFENLQFLSNAIKDYAASYRFAPATTQYALEIRTYNTSTLTLQNTTLYDTEKYTATAEYTDSNGNEQSVDVNSGAITYLYNIPFDESVVTIELTDKADTSNKTVYTFNIIRPRDITKTIKGSTGMVLVPEGRNLLPTQYKGKAEGTMFKLTDDGELKFSYGTTLDTGVSSSHYLYKCFALDGLEEFSLKFTSNTVYGHLRYSTDGGETWEELPQGGGITDKLSFAEDTAKIRVQVLDDKTYSDNVKAGKDGFADSEPNTYTVWVEQAAQTASAAQILTAATELGEWYPAFSKDTYDYTIIYPTGTTADTLTYTIADGAKVKIGNTEQTPDANGSYTLALKTSAQNLTVTSADGSVVNSYSFKLQSKKVGYPDKVIDYLCVNSQYTNGSNGIAPWGSLSGNIASLGSFGGYITYYYEDGLKNRPDNKYGIDFYVYGNANKDTSTSTKTSFFEPAQAWVSEDGENWYALAGSAHYDDGVDWDYTVNYQKTANGKTAWTDSHGNINDGTSYTGNYPLASVYYMNSLAASDSITLAGVMLPARNGEMAVSGVSVDAYPVKWGYADCFVNGTIGADVNPYTDNSNYDLQTNGFDLSWAVDADGNPVDISDMEFHYVKLQSVSNIWNTSFGDKSPEIAGVLRTTPQEEAVGKTTVPLGVTISDGADSKVINFTENRISYSADLGDMKYVSISVNGANKDDNIYINNQRISYDGAADGFKITREAGEKLIRIIVQNGDKEPVIRLLKLTGTATEANELVEGVKVNVSGSARTADTKDGTSYTTSVGYRISSIGVIPVAAADVEITVNGEALKDGYSLKTGENSFVIVGERNGISHTVTLKVTKDSAPISSGKIQVYFSLMGDDIHGDDGEIHTLKEGGLDAWIARTAYEVDTPATVRDVFEKALDGKHTFVNAAGNYISEIDGLAEFSNGANSGWLYTVNGSYSAKGIAEQSVKNGDVIVFHYTDDHTKEQGSEKWSGGGGGSAATGKITVKFDSNGGTEISSQSVSKNSVVIKPENPKKEGYEFDGWYMDEKFAKEYDFSEKVTTGFTLYAKWKESEAAFQNPFKDVEEDAWYYEAIGYMHTNNLMKGISETEFAPDDEITRAMFVTILYRIENEPKAAEVNFSDVASGEWYAKAVAWAAENKIVSGISDTQFSPNTNITREQMAAIMFRYANYKGYDTSIGENANILSYDDYSDISEFAVSALQYAVESGIMTGKTKKTLNPKDTATRAETAVVIMRLKQQLNTF